MRCFCRKASKNGEVWLRRQINDNTMEKKTTTKQTADKAQKENISYLSIIEHIVNFSKGSKLDAAFMKKTRPWLKCIADAFGITEVQATLFSICMERGPRRLDYSDIASHLGVGKVRALCFASDIDALVRRRLLRYRNVRDEEDFDIPADVIRSLKHNKVYELPPTTNLDCQGLFMVLKLWFDDLTDGAVSVEDMVNDVEVLFENNPQLLFVKKLKELEVEEEDWLLLLYFCHLLVEFEDDSVDFRQIENVAEDQYELNRMRRLMRSGDHILMQKGLIEHCSMDGLADTSHFRLTDYAKRTFLSELHLTPTEVHVSDVLKSKDLAEKQMFYPDATRAQVDELTGLFAEEQYNNIRERMKARGFRCGFACLFYGGPGTGKTETVYQMARRSGRDIMVVDVPQIKSKWVGDSEKNIKALFDRYRELQRNSERAPILLFNEADAIIGKRKVGAENAVDKMENTIQNIILQEMESLDGIMIATTNLQSNFDTAFERRFLYKIGFPRPDAAVRKGIWKEMVPELGEEELQVLAGKYELSGGQIENVARRYAIDQILHGDTDSTALERLCCHCENERMDRGEHRRIGF